MTQTFIHTFSIVIYGFLVNIAAVQLHSFLPFLSFFSLSTILAMWKFPKLLLNYFWRILRLLNCFKFQNLWIDWFKFVLTPQIQYFPDEFSLFNLRLHIIIYSCKKINEPTTCDLINKIADLEIGYTTFAMTTTYVII